MATENESKLSPTDRVMSFDDMVKFKIEYPKEHKKAKHHKDGEVIELHRLQAEDWEKRGLGKITK
jgi:hypothetical protein